MRKLALLLAVALCAALLEPVSSTAGLRGPEVTRATDPTGQSGSAGTAVAFRAGGRLVTTRAALRNAPDARTYFTGFHAWEPTIGIDSKNRIYFQGRMETGLLPQVWRSDDGGVKWKDVSPGTHLISFDPYLYVDPATDRIFTDDVQPTITCHELSYSDDAGKTWSTSVRTGCGWTTDHQTVFAGPPTVSKTVGYRNVVYECAFGLGATSVSGIAATCTKSLDGGTSWVPTGDPAFVIDPNRTSPNSPTNCYGAVGHGVTDDKGRIYLPKGWCGKPYLGISDDEGATWKRIQVSDKGSSTHDAGVAVDEQGNVYYTWIAKDRLTYLTISRDRGKTWSEPMMITPPGVVATSHQNIAIGASGKIAVFFMGTTQPKPENMKWNGYIVMTDEALAANPLFYGGPINNPSDPLQEGSSYCCDALGDFFDITIGLDGTPRAAMVDGCPAGANACYHEHNWGDAVVGRLVGGPSLR